MDTPDTTAPGAPGQARCTDGSQLRWSADEVVVERPGGDAVTFAAPETTLQLSRAELTQVPGLLARLLGVTPSKRPHLIVELRTRRQRLTLRAAAPPGVLASLPRLQARAEHVLPLTSLQALVAALRHGGARLAHGAAQSLSAPAPASAQAEGPALTYEGRPLRYGPLETLAGLLITGVAAVGLVRAGSSPWLLAAGLSVVLWLGARGAARYWRGLLLRRGGATGKASALVVLTTLATLAAAVAFGLVTMSTTSDLSAGLAWLGVFTLKVGTTRWRVGRQHWSRARLDASGLHGERPGRPRQEHIGWHELSLLRERAVCEGSQLLDRTALTADALRLSRARDATGRERLLAARVGGQTSEPVFADDDAVRSAVYWFDRDLGSQLGQNAAVLGVGVVGALLLMLYFDGAWRDARPWALMAVFLWLVVRTARLRLLTGVDRVHGLWLRFFRYGVSSPHEAESPYRWRRRDFVTATAITGFDVVERAGSWYVRALGLEPITVRHFSDEAEARRVAAELDTFFRHHGVRPSPT